MQIASSARPRPRKAHGVRNLFYFFFPVLFFAALFLGADVFFFAFPFADLAAALSSLVASAAGASGLAFGSFFGRLGAVNFCPSKAISTIRTDVNGWRCPCSFLYCFFRL